MIDLVKSHLELEFDADAAGLDAEELTPMPEPYTACTSHPVFPLHAEAPVSANCFVTIEGRDVQVTVRTGATPEQVEVVMGTMAGLLRAYSAPHVTLPQVAPAAEQSHAAEAPPPARQGRSKKRPAEKTDIWCEEDQS